MEQEEDGSPGTGKERMEAPQDGHTYPLKSGNLWPDQCLEQEASGKAKEESAPGKDDRAGVMENSREHKETVMSYVS